MPVICDNCLRNKGIDSPAIRTERGKCQFCGYDPQCDIPKPGQTRMRRPVTVCGNYMIHASQVPGDPENLDVVAEKEEAEA